MKNNTAKIIVLIIVGALLFYAGTQYAKNQPGATSVSTPSAYAARAGRGAAAGVFGGGTAGTVVSVNSQSITIALKSGGSMIIFYSTSTPITLTTAGSVNDIETGSNIMVTGSANSDGSLSAQSIRIVPSTTSTAQ